MRGTLQIAHGCPLQEKEDLSEGGFLGETRRPASARTVLSFQFHPFASGQLHRIPLVGPDFLLVLQVTISSKNHIEGDHLRSV